jgi:coenzyme PQQ precursor peptide PqqA
MPKFRGEEVESMETQLAAWETPEFDEVEVAAEITMYVAQLED